MIAYPDQLTVNAFKALRRIEPAHRLMLIGTIREWCAYGHKMQYVYPVYDKLSGEATWLIISERLQPRNAVQQFQFIGTLSDRTKTTAKG